MKNIKFNGKTVVFTEKYQGSEEEKTVTVHAKINHILLTFKLDLDLNIIAAVVYDTTSEDFVLLHKNGDVDYFYKKLSEKFQFEVYA